MITIVIGIKNTTRQYKPVLIFLRGGRVSDCNRRAHEGGKMSNQLPVEKDVAKGSIPLTRTHGVLLEVGDSR